MGIVNVTPDSFSDGGRHAHTDAAIAHGVRLWGEGADWLDVGGESTRPGAEPVPAAVECARVVPVIAGLRARLPDAVLSVDTSKAEVAGEALAAGATVVNDVTAAADPQMAPLVARAQAWLVLMHLRGTPRTMQHDTAYDDLVGEVTASLAAAVERVVAAGVDPSRVILDPGIGFAKTSADNPRLIAGLGRLLALGHPVLVGASRKRFIGDLTGVTDPAARVHGSVGAALAAVANGARILRVHDVAATIQALRVYRACVDA
ncbi:MAG: dihydropteroate synthase [Alphaproteobacteria bacterium]|nr:dihydropteroate synthase [Alphaproteobacteria bacterium]